MAVKPVKLVFFDLGNVLVYVHVGRFYAGMAHITNIPEQQVIEMLKDRTSAIVDFNCGRLSAREFYKIVCKDFAHVTMDQFRAIYTDIFSLNNETIQLAQALKQHVRISIISNTDELHFEYICKQYPSIQMFKDPILSYQIHAVKPNPEIYTQALRQVNLPAQECIFIDDLPENIHAANKIGMHGIVYTTTKELLHQLNNYNLPIKHSNVIGGF
ncbi:MAG TPA: HAD family phosphatase [bacterium]|nr:HAD family phosphatase [bacterium]HPN43302.1 HAD family phosphatase [bacterium]